MEELYKVMDELLDLEFQIKAGMDILRELEELYTSDPEKEETEIGELDEWDSLRNVQIIAQLEKEFEVKITPDMIMDLEDVSDIISLIKDLKS